ncbi:hypothetical protein LINPERPRIM_LOCUS1254 [Linum perenne]
MVLDHRYQLQVCKISFVDISALWKRRYKTMFGKVMSYASSHGTMLRTTKDSPSQAFPPLFMLIFWCLKVI